MKEISIVHVIGGFRFGGIETLVYDLVKQQLENKELSVSILVKSDKGEFKEKFSLLGVPILSINPRYTYLFSLKSIKKICCLFREADVIHFHGFHLYIAILAILSKTKIIYTNHGNFAFGREKRISDYINHFLRKIFYTRFVEIVACNSNFTKNYLINEWGISNRKLLTLYNGCGIKIPNENEVINIRKTYNGKFIVGTTSRLAGFKRIDRLIIAFIKFNKLYHSSVLLIIGEGPERHKLEILAGELLNKCIFLLGYKSDPINYQAAFDVCVFASNNEPFGLVAVESYMAKRPVVVFADGGGLTEIVRRCNPVDVVDDTDSLVKRLEYYFHGGIFHGNTSNAIEYFSSKRMESEYFYLYK